MSLIELDPPRWSGGPKICPKANLPYFEDEKEFEKFEKKIAPESGCSGTLVKCKCCGGIHLLTGAMRERYIQSKKTNNKTA